MAKCTKCGKRKAKRPCPAQGIILCSLCCGRLREKKIDCPSACSFLDRHKAYQEKREFEQRNSSVPFPLSPEEDILADERMAWLALHAEVTFMTAAEKDSSLTDKDVQAALDYALSQIEKRRAIILTSQRDTGPSNEIGEAIIRSLNQCRYEKKIILPDDHLAYSDEEQVKCLERIKLSLLHISKDRPSGRRYIDTVRERFAQIRSLAQADPFLSLK